MLTRTAADGESGRRGASIGLSPRWLLLAALLVVVPILLAIVVTALFGKLFGVWGWTTVPMILLLAETVILLGIGMYRGEHNPYRTIVPGANHWGMRTNDPQVIYAGSLRPPVAKDARTSSDTRPLLLAIAPALGALAMLGVVIVESSDDASATPQPEPLPIVTVDGSISIMLESVEVTSEQMTLAIRIDDFQWGRSSGGYLTPQPEDITLNGQPIEVSALQSANFNSILRTDKSDVSGLVAWRLHLPLAPPDNPTEPVTVTLHTLRFAPNHRIPDLPEKIDAEWSFTFVPAT